MIRSNVANIIIRCEYIESTCRVEQQKLVPNCKLFTNVSIDDSSYRLNFDLGKSFGSRVVQISARNTKVYKICKICRATVYFPHLTTFRDQALQFY